MPEIVVPFSHLTPDQQASFSPNWVAHTADGQQIANWSSVVDQRYGTLRHVAIVNQETGRIFDKVDLDWSPAAFVVIYRKKGSRTEFFIQNERRVLLQDENGVQGQVKILNIPQGLVKTWENESPMQAALREVKEETGLEPVNIQKLENVYLDAANSKTAMPFFLAQVSLSQSQQYQQQLEESEDIEAGEKNWYAFEDIPNLRIQCAKTLSGLMLATGFLGLLQLPTPSEKMRAPKTFVPESLDPSFGQRLKAIRTKLQHTQLNLSRILGVSENQISRLESGTRRPSRKPYFYSFLEYIPGISRADIEYLLDAPDMPRISFSKQSGETPS